MHARIKHKRKLSRKIGPRQALVRGLVDSLILYERIETTEAKAKTVAPVFERLVTHAKKDSLAGKRKVYSEVSSKIAGEKLISELTLGFQDRQGGYTRIIKTGYRRGDNAPMALVELVLPDNFDELVQENRKIQEQKAAPKTKKTVKKPAAKKTNKAKTTTPKSAQTKKEAKK